MAFGADALGDAAVGAVAGAGAIVAGIQEAVSFFSSALILSCNWRTVFDQGLTKHENWWPAVYEQACRNWGEQPDERIMAFATTYEGARADLKQVGVGGSG